MAEHLETSLEDDESAPLTEAEVLGPGAWIGQYEIIRELGRGAMGVVYAARDTRLGRRVAIKFVHQASGEIAQRFLIEARALARCEHPNIVVIHAVDDYDGLPYLVLEFLEGHTLRDLLEAAPRLPASRVVELALPIARALACAHAAEIIHRDLKPENVFLTTAGQIKVLDFGIAKAVGDERPSAQRLTGKHSLLGTITYMSPEQMGSEAVDARSDVWALGIMLFEMLAGRHPIDPLTTEALFTNAVSDDAMPSLAAIAPDVPARLANLVDRCLAKARANRPASDEVARELEELLPGRRLRALGDNESPYPGLAAFQEADAGRFFGRDAEIARTVVRVRELPMFGVIGPSGAGKSSFVRAGVAPALKASGERWEVVTLRPGRHPMQALAAVLLRATAPVGNDAPTQAGLREETVRRLRTEHGYLGSLLRAHARRTRQHVLVFVDQLEELFTLAADPSERHAFTAALAGAADDPSAPVRVIVAMRSDFLDRLVDHGTFVEELSRGIQLLSTPDRAGLRDALEQPLALDGYAFESEQIVVDMLDALEGTSGALPLLQFCAAKLWDGRDTPRKLITLASYHAIGGISGALATHADEVIANLDTNAQRLARKILRSLVTPERTRAIVELADLQALAADRADANRVIDQLVGARLVVVQKRGDAGGTAELVHESLIERWPMLRRWIDEDQEDAAYLAQIAAAAKQWESRGRPQGLLWRGDAAIESMRWVAARARELPRRDRAFLDAVGALGRRGARRRRRIAIGAFALLGAIAAAAIVGVVQVDKAREEALHNAGTAAHNAELWRQAASARDEEERQKRLAEARRDDAERQAVDASARAEHEKQEAEARRQAAERERLAAEHAKQQVELAAAQTATQTREQLQQKNLELEAALREARAATERAEKAVADAHKAEAVAQKSAADAEQTKRALEKALEAERQRVKQLDEEKRKLSTQLKE